MLDVLASITDYIDQYVLWIYGICALIIVLQLRTLLRAGRERSNTMFTVEKEVWAHRQKRAIGRTIAMLILIAVIAGCNHYLLPNIDLTQYASPTPTHTLPIPTLAPTTLTPSPTPTNTPAPIVIPTAAAPIPTAIPDTPTPVLAAPPSCTDPNIQIVSPGVDAAVSGSVPILGTATGGQFNFYKVEYAIGETPQQWNVTGSTHGQPVVGGQLETLNTQSFPNGIAWVRLTVVDITGNYPAPCEVRINIQN